jgi:peptide/nickel transport system ATP-binding protein
MIEPLLSIRGLRVHFHTEEGAIPAVAGVDLDIPRGKILALVGESGCGKSVTAYSILRLIQPPGRIEGGQILFAEKDGQAPIDIAALDDGADALYHLRGGAISMIFQEPMSALSPVHRVGDQIAEAILLHRKVGKAEARRLAIGILGRVGIPDPEHRVDQYPFELSGGMRQRVVIAMALVCQPALLIADEPTTALDVTIQAQILHLIRRMRDEAGSSVLFITHDLGVVAQMADEVAVMYLGRVVEQGTVRQVLKSPRHPYTRDLLDSHPGLADRGKRLSVIHGSVPSLNAIPPGCPFHPRCAHALAGLCDAGDAPPSRPRANGQRSACLRVAELYPEPDHA